MTTQRIIGVLLEEMWALEHRPFRRGDRVLVSLPDGNHPATIDCPRAAAWMASVRFDSGLFAEVEYRVHYSQLRLMSIVDEIAVLGEDS